MSDACVDLIYFNQAALIVLMPTGVQYSNQVNGTGCFHPYAEGFLVPIDTGHFGSAEPERGLCPRLMKRFESGVGVVSPDDADFIDAILAESLFTRGIRVDRSRLGTPSLSGDVSMEAWVHVTLGDWLRDAGPFAALYESNATAAILTWPNSD